jgi:C4-type Zn-finger protein
MSAKERYHGSAMADIKECPLCGESMRLQICERLEHVPGTGQTTTRTVREWVCPECDYWEEAESER